MGGDKAPKNIVLGAIEAYTQMSPGSRIVLFGDKEQIVKICDEAGFDHNKLAIAHTTEVIEMSDHPARAFQQKKDSSITVGFKALYSGDIDGFASAGNTGAMLVGTSYTIKSIIGIIRPCISATFPVITGAEGILLDVGLNPDCRPDILAQYGILGSIYATHMLNIDNPRIGLLNIGEEEEKGNLLTKAAYELMKEESYNFIGNIEGRDILSGEKADVIVCDGFVGNVLLKQSEALYGMAQKLQIKHDYFNRFNYELQGGTPVLGVNAPVIIGHGASSPLAIKNMILQTEHAIGVDLVSKFKEAL